MFRRGIQHHRRRRRHRHGPRRHALLAALARDHRRQRRIHGQRPQGRCAGLHLELRQNHPRNADGRHAAQHPDGLRVGRADGGGQIRREGHRPDRRDGHGGRRSLQRRADRARRTLRLPRLRLVFGHVHGQFDELPDRSAGTLAAGQRHDRRHARQPTPAVRRRRGADRPQRRTLLFSGRRIGAPAFGRDQSLLRERHVARHRHGRLDQHGAPPAGRGPRSRRGFHDAGHRPPFASDSGALQGGSQLAVSHTGRQPRRRHPLHSGRTGARRPARHLGPAHRRADAPRSNRRLRPAQRDADRRGPAPLAERPCGALQPRTGGAALLLRRPRRKPHDGLYPRRRTRLLPRRGTGRADGQHRPQRLHRQDGGRR